MNILIGFFASETARLLLCCTCKVVQQPVKPSLFTPDSGSTNLLTTSPLLYLQYHFTAFSRTEWYSPNGGAEQPSNNRTTRMDDGKEKCDGICNQTSVPPI